MTDNFTSGTVEYFVNFLMRVRTHARNMLCLMCTKMRVAEVQASSAAGNER